jgi:hypothetical protein
MQIPTKSPAYSDFNALIALFEDFKQIVPRVGIERFEAPIVENEKFDARERLA